MLLAERLAWVLESRSRSRHLVQQSSSSENYFVLSPLFKKSRYFILNSKFNVVSKIFNIFENLSNVDLGQNNYHMASC